MVSLFFPFPDDCRLWNAMGGVLTMCALCRYAIESEEREERCAGDEEGDGVWHGIRGVGRV